MKFPSIYLLLSTYVLAQVTPSQDATLTRQALDAVKSASAAAVPAASGGNQAAGFSGNEPAVEDLAPQEVLLRPAEQNRWTASTTGNFTWESNPGFSPGSGVESLVYAQSLTLRGQETFADEWLADVSIQELVYRYEDIEALNFDRFAAKANLTWAGLLDHENDFLRGWLPTVGFEWYRLNAGGNWSDLILDNTFANIGVARVFNLGAQNQALLALNSSLSLDASNPLAQRDEHSLTAAWLARWAPRWESTLFARAAFFDYDQREDLNYSAGLSVDYIPTKNFRMGLSMMAVKNTSTNPLFEYENVGLGVSFNLWINF